MNAELVKDYLLEFSKSESPKLTPRDLKVSPSIDTITTIYGPRRSGKTYYFYQLMQSYGRGNCLYLNFEDTRLYGLRFEDVRGALRLFIELFGKEPDCVFMDEAQVVEKWEIALRELHDRHKYRIFVTGSSSKLLTKEIATQLRGRGISYILLPFSFREFLRARGVGTERITLDEQARIRGQLKEYLEYGGFPQVIFGEGEDRLRLLKEFFDMILYKDVVERHGVKNTHLSSLLFKQLVASFSSEFSVNKLYNHFRSSGVKLSKDTLYSYLNYFEDSAGVFFLKRYSEKVRVKESWPRKVYLCDTGLAKVWKASEETGRLMENAVFLELLRARNLNPLLDVCYWKGNGGEVDFVVSEGGGVKALVQVTYATSPDEIEERETRALTKAAKELGCGNLTVVTWDYAGKGELDGRVVEYAPLWKWLMSNALARG